MADQKEGRVAPHPSAVLQAALAVQEGLREDRVVKPEGPVVMRGESHWAEVRGVHRMHPVEERTQAGLKRWLVGLSAKVVAREGRHPLVESQGVQVA